MIPQTAFACEREIATMSNHWDEFSKSLAEPVPRRESLRRLGLALSAAVLGPLGGQFAGAGHQDPCKAFCRCSNHRQKDQCLKVCKACNKDVSRLAGSCGNYVCCGAGQTSCGSYCADLASDPYNCGACGYACHPPGPYEYGACIDGGCEYVCAEGAVYCGDVCTFLGWDPNNCGACGNVCGGPNPSCYGGACSQCTPSCPEGWCGGDGCGGECACPSGMYCEYNYCYADCVFPFILCGGVCVDPTSDRYNCGGCGVQCADDEACISGFCVSY
jgi:hypothetical protein